MPPFIHASRGTVFVGGPGGHTFFGALFAFLVLCLLVVLVAAAVSVLVRGARWRGPRRGPAREGGPRPEAPAASSSDEALRILNERFARGEIDADEYTTRRDLIKQSV